MHNDTKANARFGASFIPLKRNANFRFTAVDPPTEIPRPSCASHCIYLSYSFRSLSVDRSPRGRETSVAIPEPTKPMSSKVPVLVEARVRVGLAQDQHAMHSLKRRVADLVAQQPSLRDGQLPLSTVRIPHYASLPAYIMSLLTFF